MVLSSIPSRRSIDRLALHEMDDRLRAGIPPRYVTSHPGQLRLLLYMGRELSTGQSAVMLCGWK